MCQECRSAIALSFKFLIVGIVAVAVVVVVVAAIMTMLRPIATVAVYCIPMPLHKNRRNQTKVLRRAGGHSLCQLDLRGRRRRGEWSGTQSWGRNSQRGSEFFECGLRSFVLRFRRSEFYIAMSSGFRKNSTASFLGLRHYPDPETQHPGRNPCLRAKEIPIISR